MNLSLTISILTLLFALVEDCSAYQTYIGYSGFPGRQACSISYHPQHNFAPTMTVSGLPELYVPGLQYTITVAHNGGREIRQFNCSVRIGSGSSNAGLIASGTNTATYNTAGETNGAQLNTAGLNSGVFRWTAPVAGTGTVRLCWAGLQGGLGDGADAQIVLISTEDLTGIEANRDLPNSVSLS